MSEARQMRRGNKKDTPDKKIDLHARKFFDEWQRGLKQLDKEEYKNMEWEDCPIQWKNHFKRMALQERISQEPGLLRKKRHLKAEGVYKQSRKDRIRLEEARRKQGLIKEDE